ncbi:hypothetical protein P5V15_009990 [Pogonomyrmex californicus]
MGGHSPAGTYVTRQHGRVRDAGEKIMADAGTLRGPAVAGPAGAVVERVVGSFQLHVARMTARVASKAEAGLERYRARLQRHPLSPAVRCASEKKCDECETNVVVRADRPVALNGHMYVEREGNAHESQVP